MTEVPNLSQAARETSVVVIGGGIAGLVAAYECARIGMPVTVLEASAELGGVARSIEIDGVRVPLGAISFADGEAVDTLVTTLTDDIADFDPQRISALQAVVTTTTPKGLRPLPDNVLGIPGNPFDAKAVAITGWAGAWRAYVDRLRPPLTIGHQDNLDKLVRSRMGAKVADRLVAPVVRADLGMSAADVDLSIAAPDVNPALTRLGSLSGAALEILTERTDTRRSLEGTLAVVVDALAQRITELGGVIKLESPATGISKAETPTDTDAYIVSYAETDTGDEAEPAEPAEATVRADVVFVATEEAAARTLVAEILRVPAPVAEPSFVASVVAIADGDVSQMGTRLAPQSDASAIEAVDNLTAAWGITPATGVLLRARMTVEAHLDLDEVAKTGAAALSALLGVPVREVHAVVTERAPHAEAAGFKARTAPLRSRSVRGGAVIPVGAWVSGTGLDRVVADTQAAVESVRRRVLFG